MSARSGDPEPGYIMRPPTLAHETSSPGTLGQHTTGAASLKFTKNRQRTKKCARWVMYTGYLLMILDALGVILIFLELFGRGQHHRMVKRRRERNPGGQVHHQRAFRDDEIFSFGQQVGIDIFKLLHAAALFAQGWFMVRATKIVIRQISTQEVNPSAQIEKHSEKVSKLFKAVVMLIVGGLLIKAAANLYAFIVVDNFFADKFKDDYKDWKADTKLQYMDPNKLKIEKARWERMDEIEGWWSIFGPTAMMIDLALTACCCSCVLFCFNSYKKGLTDFEESPNNPSFSNF